jgi:hypothetical protein
MLRDKIEKELKNKTPSDNLKKSINEINSGTNLTSYDGKEYLSIMKK